MILLIGSLTPVFSRSTGNDVYTAHRAYKMKFWRERRGRQVPEITVQHCNAMGKCYTFNIATLWKNVERSDAQVCNVRL